ncbi:hypothetical protein [Formosa sp. A9]|uniref:hypothetical protein n=1 Tax=Formosa sp. A9 TaxID=3442641 RepID=UPI003EBE2A5C
MTTNKLSTLILGLFLYSFSVCSQSNTLSSSPYSLYGLGLLNTTNTGKTTSLGNTGIANSSRTFINNANPASFAYVPLNTFFFDVGIKSTYGVQIDGGSQDSKINANFSNMAFAFPINSKSGLSLTLIPYTNVGYSLNTIETDIEGTSNVFYSDIEGSGGLNDLKINYGYKLLDNLSLGLTSSLLFGQITETETNYIANNTLSIYDANSYSGFRLGAGIQYSPFKNTTLGSIVNLPTRLSGEKDTTVSQIYDGDVYSNEDLDDFKLPLEIGFGVQTTYLDQVTVALDYKKYFWSNTNQTDQLGTFVDQNIFGLGVEFAPNINKLKFWNTLQYRAGFNYDSGNLEITGQKINNYTLDVGLGIPLRYDGLSMLNISYAYGTKGQVYNNLIQEHYHLLTLNISLAGRWFEKRKFN